MRNNSDQGLNEAKMKPKKRYSMSPNFSEGYLNNPFESDDKNNNSINSETQLQSSVHKSNDKRFDDMKKIIDKRFDDMEEKFDLKFNLIVENISKSDKTNKGFFITVIAVIITLIIVLIISKYLNWLFWI